MKKVLILLLILPFACICIAQSTQPNELHFNRLSIKNGLPEEAIIATLQDKEGYIWIGTQGGLVRYDGYIPKLYQFNLDDPNHASIMSIYEDRSGELWIGTQVEGLYYYNRAADTFVQYKHNSKDVNSVGAGMITSIHDDRNANLWMILSDFDGTKKSLNFFDTKNHQFKHFGNLEKGNHYINVSDYSSNLFEDSKGRIWIGTNNGIYEYLPSADKFIPHFASADAEQHKGFGWLTEDAAHPGIIWMNAWNFKLNKGEGLLRYNTDDNTAKTYHHAPGDSTSLGNDNVYTIQKDSQGRMWIGADNDLSLFDPASERFANYHEVDKQTNPFENKISSIKEDKGGNLWCISAIHSENNLLFFDTKTRTFKQYTGNDKDPDALPANNVGNLLIDRSGTLWVGTAFQGLYWLNNNRSRFIAYKNNPGQSHYFPGGGNTSFAEDKDGTFWVWSSHGLYHWYPSSDSFTFIKDMNDQGEYFVWHFSSVLIDRKGIIWCSSFGKGLFSYNPKTGEIKNFKNDQKDSTSISSDYITWLYEDDKATLWIATMGNGICSFNGQNNTFKQYPYVYNAFNTPNNNALDDAVVYKIFEDAQSVLWAGTNMGGLNRYNREAGTFTSYQNQLPGFVTVTDIFEDSKKHLWAGTHQGGLFLFDRKVNRAKKISEKDGLLCNEVIAINEDNENNLWITSPRGISILNIQTNKISHFGTINGLPEDAENNSNLFKTSTGQFLMPCNNGFVSFYPDQLKPDTTLPIIRIESVEFTRPQKQENKQTDSIIQGYGKTKINLRYNENRITFNYVGLQYQNSALNQYAYKLDGYDKDWIQAGTQRKVTYTNLSPRKYIFHVKAANSDGVWNTKEQTLTVIITPPWWLTWWAYLLYVIIFALAVRAFIAYRSRSLISKNKVLEEKVEHRTEQLTQSLENLKATQAQLIQSEKMASLGELTAGVAHEIQNPLNFVNNFSEVNSELIVEMQEELKAGNSNEAIVISNNIKENQEKINHHGKRADAIVKGMLQHSRSSSSVKEPTDINALADEYVRLAYHGLRAKDKSLSAGQAGFNAKFETDFDPSIEKIDIVPQDIGRVILNLINNAFYAVTEKKKTATDDYEPTVRVSTKLIVPPPTGGGQRGAEIRVKDNGNGIPPKVLDKIFQPFFTTKPTGQGTGLGLSLSYDIIKAHGGEIKVETKEGEGAAFIIQLPVKEVL